MKRKLIAMIVLSVIMLVGVTACGKTDSEEENIIVDSEEENVIFEEDSASETKELIEYTEKNAEYRGICGVDAKWYYKDNVLVIKGTGEITDDTWNDEDEMNVSWLIIDEGITAISCFRPFSGYDDVVAVDLVKVVLPSSLKKIADELFYECESLKDIGSLDSIIEIGGSAFYGTSITSIYIPSSAKKIDTYAFYGCPLTKIEVDKGNAYYDSRDNCNALIDTEENCLLKGCDSSVIPDGITTIANDAFSGCKSLTSINIPDSVTSIG